MVAIGCAGGDPGRQRPGLADAFLEDLAVARLFVVKEVAFVFWFVQLPAVGIDARLTEQRLASRKYGPSSAMMGTRRRPISLLFKRPVSMRTKAIVVELSRSSLSKANPAKLARVGTSRLAAVVARAGTKPPSCFLRSCR